MSHPLSYISTFKFEHFCGTNICAPLIHLNKLLRLGSANYEIFDNENDLEIAWDTDFREGKDVRIPCKTAILISCTYHSLGDLLSFSKFRWNAITMKSSFQVHNAKYAKITWKHQRGIFLLCTLKCHVTLETKLI